MDKTAYMMGRAYALGRAYRAGRKYIGYARDEEKWRTIEKTGQHFRIDEDTQEYKGQSFKARER